MEWLIKQLLKPRWFTKNEELAEKSPCQWKVTEQGFSLSILGAINAIATWTGYALVVVDNKRFIFKKAWW